MRSTASSQRFPVRIRNAQYELKMLSSVVVVLSFRHNALRSVLVLTQPIRPAVSQNFENNF